MNSEPALEGSPVGVEMRVPPARLSRWLVEVGCFYPLSAMVTAKMARGTCFISHPIELRTAPMTADDLVEQRTRQHRTADEAPPERLPRFLSRGFLPDSDQPPGDNATVQRNGGPDPTTSNSGGLIHELDLAISAGGRPVPKVKIHRLTLEVVTETSSGAATCSTRSP
jgi:hypothetical protein